MCAFDQAAPVRTRWEWEIEADSDSLNAHRQNDARGWAYRKQRDQWTVIMKNAARRADITRPEEKRRVTITRLYSGRQQERDHDNLVGGMKPLVDALERAGIVVSDAKRWAEIHYLQERSERRAIRVVVEELGTPP